MLVRPPAKRCRASGAVPRECWCDSCVPSCVELVAAVSRRPRARDALLHRLRRCALGGASLTSACSSRSRASGSFRDAAVFVGRSFTIVLSSISPPPARRGRVSPASPAPSSVARPRWEREARRPPFLAAALYPRRFDDCRAWPVAGCKQRRRYLGTESVRTQRQARWRKGSVAVATPARPRAAPVRASGACEQRVRAAA